MGHTPLGGHGGMSGGGDVTGPGQVPTQGWGGSTTQPHSAPSSVPAWPQPLAAGVAPARPPAQPCPCFQPSAPGLGTNGITSCYSFLPYLKRVLF
uniref:Uncharacterized protein n=1 Tax=Terrapene triunguis TaxID=2587831 RepID=A0A674I5J1_9SAUR